MDGKPRRGLIANHGASLQLLGGATLQSGGTRISC
jgi:hypothetical protein